QVNENSSDLSDAPDVRAARPLGPFTPNVGGTRRTSSPTKHRSCALARSGSTSPPCRDRVLHVAAFGYALLEIVPSSLSRGNPATRRLRGVCLDWRALRCSGLPYLDAVSVPFRPTTRIRQAPPR